MVHRSSGQLTKGHTRGSLDSQIGCQLLTRTEFGLPLLVQSNGIAPAAYLLPLTDFALLVLYPPNSATRVSFITPLTFAGALLVAMARRIPI